MANERILVCMPTYHSPIEWVARAVESLKKQSYDNFDCWIVKDGCRLACGFYYCERACLECESCEAACDYCRSVVQDDERFHFYRLPVHLGGAGWGPRNFAILNTKHELIAYLDDDNWYEPDHLESLVNIIEGVDLAYTGTRLISSDGSVYGERIHNKAPAAGGIDTSEMMHRRKLILDHGGWRYVPKCNDWDIVKRWKDVSWAHTGKVTLNFFLRDNCGVHRP